MLLLVVLLGCVLADGPPPVQPVLLSSAQLSELHITLPLGAEPVSSACLQSSVYQDEDELLTILPGSEDSAYYCAFTAFQANKDKSTEVYSSQEEAALRFGYFKASVDKVNIHNAGDHSWTQGINFFADMSEEEKSPYFNGIRRPGGFGLGA